MGISRRYRGTGSAVGVVPMDPEPDYSMGDDRWSAWLGTTGVRRVALQVEGLDGEVALQGCNGRPSESDEWYTISTLVADGRIAVEDEAIAFLRVNKTVHNSGDAICMLTVES